MAVSVGRIEQGTSVLAAVARLLEDLDAVLHSEGSTAYDSAVEFAREHMGEADFARAWQHGLTLSIEQAVEYAVQDTAPPHQ